MVGLTTEVRVIHKGRTIERVTCSEVPIVGDYVTVLDSHGFRDTYKVLRRTHRLGQYVELNVEKL